MMNQHQQTLTTTQQGPSAQQGIQQVVSQGAPVLIKTAAVAGGGNTVGGFGSGFSNNNVMMQAAPPPILSIPHNNNVYQQQQQQHHQQQLQQQQQQMQQQQQQLHQLHQQQQQQLSQQQFSQQQFSQQQLSQQQLTQQQLQQQQFLALMTAAATANAATTAPSAGPAGSATTTNNSGLVFPTYMFVNPTTGQLFPAQQAATANVPVSAPATLPAPTPTTLAAACSEVPISGNGCGGGAVISANDSNNNNPAGGGASGSCVVAKTAESQQTSAEPATVVDAPFAGSCSNSQYPAILGTNRNNNDNSCSSKSNSGFNPQVIQQPHQNLAIIGSDAVTPLSSVDGRSQQLHNPTSGNAGVVAGEVKGQHALPMPLVSSSSSDTDNCQGGGVARHLVQESSMVEDDPAEHQGTSNTINTTLSTTTMMMTPEERSKRARDRNREHARSTRMRKKAYVEELKELADGLNVERSEEQRQRVVATERLVETQKVRRTVLQTFLKLHASHDPNKKKYMTLLEDKFWLKQPITPYRAFPGVEIHKECRILRGVDAVMQDAASLAVMLEGIGSRNTRWVDIKRKEFKRIHRISDVQQPVNRTPPLAADASINASQLPAPPAEPPSTAASTARTATLPPNIARRGGILHGVLAPPRAVPSTIAATPAPTPAPAPDPTQASSPPATAASNECQSSENERLKHAPQVALPPFFGIGKRAPGATTATGVAAAPVPTAATSATSSTPAFAPSSNVAVECDGGGTPITERDAPSAVQNVLGTVQNAPVTNASTVPSTTSALSLVLPPIRGFYHTSEDDMLVADDVLMCRFVFRTHGAISRGALAECISPGMLRAQFSPRHKLLNLELVYDAMGLMQQLERASGGEGIPHIIPSSIEQALTPTATEARVITRAENPFSIMSVNEAWTKASGFTQMEVEGRAYESLLCWGEGTVLSQGAIPDSTKLKHNLEDVACGMPACSTNMFYDRNGLSTYDFVCSYPLTNANGEVTALLHLHKELKEIP